MGYLEYLFPGDSQKIGRYHFAFLRQRMCSRLFGETDDGVFAGFLKIRRVFCIVHRHFLIAMPLCALILMRRMPFVNLYFCPYTVYKKGIVNITFGGSF